MRIFGGMGLKKKIASGYTHSLRQEVERYKKEKDILLALSNDIIGVREIKKSPL